MKKVKILLDNGHGVDCPGKRSPDAVKGITDSKFYFREYAWAREVAQICYSLLRLRGFDVELLVPEEKDIPLSVRVKRANEWCKKRGNDRVIVVSIHNNAAGNGSKWMSARGWATYTSPGVTKSDKLADFMYQAAESIFKYPQKVRKYKDKYLEKDWEENFTILTKTYCPAVLVENFFQDNRDDVWYLKSDEGKAACSKVIIKGIESYINSLG